MYQSAVMLEFKNNAIINCVPCDLCAKIQRFLLQNVKKLAVDFNKVKSDKVYLLCPKIQRCEIKFENFEFSHQNT